MRSRSLILLSLALFPINVAAQSLDDRLDDDAFLRGLSEYGLGDLIEHAAGGAEANAGSVRALQVVIAREEAAYNAAPAGSSARRQSLDRLLAARRALIEQFPNEPNVALWMTDLAADLYFRLLGEDATETVVLFGLPTIDQRRIAREAAIEIDELAAEAELAITDAILEIESTPGYRDNIALQLDRRRLADEERDRRIPFLRGVGAVLRAELAAESPEAQRERLHLADETLGPLSDRLEGSVRRRAQVYHGLALARLGLFEAAEAAFRAAATDEDADALDVFSARMGGVLNRTEQRGPQAGLEALESIAPRYTAADELFYRLIIADQRFILRRDLARRASAADRPRLLADAFAGYLTLLDDVSGREAAALRRLVFEKMAAAADAETPLDQLPAIVTIARAEAMAEHEATRSEAIALFETALARNDLDDRATGLALDGLGRALYRNGQPLAAADRFFTLASAHAGDPLAERAIGLAAAILVQQQRADPEDDGLIARTGEVLTLALERFPMLPEIERWRYELARLEVERELFAQARSRIEQIPPGAAVYHDGRMLLARAARNEAAATREPAAQLQAWQRARQTITAVRNQLHESFQRASGAARDELRIHLDTLTVLEAEAALGAGRPAEALSLLESMDIAAVDRVVAAELLTIRIRALQESGQLDEARRAVDQFMRAVPEAAGRVVPSLLDSIAREVEGMRNRGQTEQANERAARDLRPLAEGLESWARSRALAPAALDAILLTVAEAYRLAGDFEPALRLFDEVLARQPAAREAIVGRAECLFGLARYGEAMTLFRRLSADREADRDELFWLAELRMLQILDRAGQGTNQIRPRIMRLRAIDPTFGRERFRREFELLLNKYS